MTLSLRLLLRIVVINDNFALWDPRETEFSVQDWEGRFEVASAEWLLLLGR